MRLSEWRAKAPFKNSVAPKVVAVIEAALAALGGERDPACWVVWGDDPTVRYLVLAPTPSGLVQLNVRVYVPGEGPRASGKVVRWNRVQLGELAVEIQAGHRLVTFQVEMQVLNGADAVADRISDFAQVLFAAVDGRTTWTAAARRAGTRKVDSAKAGAAKSDARPSAARATGAGKATSVNAGTTPASPPTTTNARASVASTLPRVAAPKGTKS